MTGKTMHSILKRVSGDITETRELLDSFAGLLKSLELPDLKCSESENDLIKKTKDLVDQLEGKITSMHSYFYKQYNIWKSKRGSCTENESKGESSESEGSSTQASCVVDDSFNSVSDSINAVSIMNENENSDKTEDVTPDLEDNLCSSVMDTNSVEADADIENTKDSSPNKKNKENKKNSRESDGIRSENSEIQNISNSLDNTEPADVSPEPTKNSEIQNISNNLDNATSRDVSPEPIENREIQNISNNLDNAATREVSPELKCSTIDEHGEMDNITEVVADDVNNENILENIYSSSKDNCADNESDPLNIDNNSMGNDIGDCSSTSKAIKSEEIIKTEADAVKQKGTLKIKCVDIKKLLDPETVSSDIVMNNSVVVISDSDNECSSKKQNKKPHKDDSSKLLKKLLKNPVTVPAKKKVIVLDDSDSNDEVIKKKEETKVKSQSRDKKAVKFNLRSSKSDETSNTRRNPRRKVVQDLVNVSSLSENSSTTSGSESSDDIPQSKKKIKGRKNVSVDNTILLKARQDGKFKRKAYVPLTRIPADRLKANYMKKVLKMDIGRLTNLKNLKRSRKHSESSDATESNRQKKRHRSKDKAKNTDRADSSDASSKNASESNSENSNDEGNHIGAPDPKKNEVDIAEALLGGINSDNSNSDACSDREGQNKEEEEVKSSKKKESKEKTTKKDDKSASKEDDKKSNDDDDSDQVDKRKKKWRKDKLLTENITESDSDEDFAKFMKKKDKQEEKMSDTEAVTSKKSQKRLKKQKKKNVLGSDSDSRASTRSRSDLSTDKSSSSDSDRSSDDRNKKKKTTRRRIKKMKDSSDSENEDKSTRKNIRKVWKNDCLSETTIAAEKEEQERKQRIAERQKKYNQIFEADSLEKSSVDKVVLDFNEETEEELLKIDPKIVKHLKPHQAKGVQFMWNTCFESLIRTHTTKGSGCILAHCMGLGKTLQVIALIHTLLANRDKTDIKKVMVVCPMGTVLNWVAEFQKWLPDDEVEIFELVSLKQNTERMYQVKEWDRIGGALILGYDMFRNLTNSTNKRLTKKMRSTFQTCLVDPGPDLVVCDEGHLLKNEKTSISIAMNRLQSLRRIVLTGTPLQNNLKEYFCMVQFVKPSLLGTYKEYLNRFVNPITNGQYTDSTLHDIQIMRKRSHVLHKLLDGVVQRKDYSVLAPFLPPKYEYVLFVSLTELQIKLYEHYIKERSRRNSGEGGRSFLFVDFNEFQRIGTHPRVLLDKTNELKQARDKDDFLDDESEGSLREFIDDDEDSTSSSSSSNKSDSGSGDNHKQKKKKKKLPPKQRITRATPAIYKISDDENTPEALDPSEWWRQFCTDDDLDNLCHSGKIALLFEVLQHCEMIGDKVLIFSQSLYSLNVIEYFLNKVDEGTQNGETNGFCGFSGSWALGLDYFRLDGSSSCDSRAASCKMFNDPNNTRARLFLISTRAGGLGINLFAANRVIIFDVSWNPSHDTQSIYRVYRFGQTKPCYIYRFVTLGAMEMKIYERQVIKQAISKRVIDEQQIDRHYNQNDLAELYKFEPVPEEERPIPLVPKDVLLGELLQTNKRIYKYHEHHSLLENKVDEVLDEEERKAAWEEFENEKLARSNTGTINNYPVQMLRIGIQSIIRKENPTWQNDLVIKESALLFKRLEEEVQMGPSPLFQRVVTEIRVLQQAQEHYLKMMQQQQALLQFRQQLAHQYNYSNRMPNTSFTRHPNGIPTNGMPSAAAFRQATLNPTEYIDLND